MIIKVIKLVNFNYDIIKEYGCESIVRFLRVLYKKSFYWIKEIKKRGWVEYSFGAKVHNYKLVFEAALYWFLKSKKIKILTNTLGGYGFIYRSFYENKYLKRTFSMTLLLIQIKEIPKKIFNSIF
jgi:hypothetical protein